MRIGTREDTVVLKEGRKCTEEVPKSGGAEPSAKRSGALRSGGRTVARVTERGGRSPRGRPPLLLQARASRMIVCEGSPAAPQAEQARGRPRAAPQTGGAERPDRAAARPSQEHRDGRGNGHQGRATTVSRPGLRTGRARLGRGARGEQLIHKGNVPKHPVAEWLRRPSY